LSTIAPLFEHKALESIGEITIVSSRTVVRVGEVKFVSTRRTGQRHAIVRRTAADANHVSVVVTRITGEGDALPLGQRCTAADGRARTRKCSAVVRNRSGFRNDVAVRLHRKHTVHRKIRGQVVYIHIQPTRIAGGWRAVEPIEYICLQGGGIRLPIRRQVDREERLVEHLGLRLVSANRCGLGGWRRPDGGIAVQKVCRHRPTGKQDQSRYDRPQETFVMTLQWFSQLVHVLRTAFLT